MDSSFAIFFGGGDQFPEYSRNCSPQIKIDTPVGVISPTPPAKGFKCFTCTIASCGLPVSCCILLICQNKEVAFRLHRRHFPKNYSSQEALRQFPLFDKSTAGRLEEPVVQMNHLKSSSHREWRLQARWFWVLGYNSWKILGSATQTHRRTWPWQLLLSPDIVGLWVAVFACHLHNRLLWYCQLFIRDGACRLKKSVSSALLWVLTGCGGAKNGPFWTK